VLDSSSSTASSSQLVPAKGTIACGAMMDALLGLGPSRFLFLARQRRSSSCILGVLEHTRQHCGKTHMQLPMTFSDCCSLIAILCLDVEHWSSNPQCHHPTFGCVSLTNARTHPKLFPAVAHCSVTAQLGSRSHVQPQAWCIACSKHIVGPRCFHCLYCVQRSGTCFR